ncbi:UNVERIFIED_CONTAM: hypothetical protein PYX00_011759 [Menopon gallinae]|uniref:t-SNARE coiled-coil homology domain-containing protein n=1 Tax=Menopon gallinae TaxID=328185 RepID=A0AAW2H8E4_9NEOP
MGCDVNMLLGEDLPVLQLVQPRMVRTEKHTTEPIISGDVNTQGSILCFLDAEHRLLVHTNTRPGELKHIGSMCLDGCPMNVCFVDDFRLLCGHSSGMVVEENLSQHTRDEYACHRSSVRCMRTKTRSMFFSGDREGKAVGWDTRTKAPAYVLAGEMPCARSAGKSVTSIAFNVLYDFLVYTSESPGGIVSCWDLRYTERGQVRRVKNNVCDRLILDMRHDVSGLLALAEDHQVLELSDQGVMRSRTAVSGKLRSFQGTLALFKHLRLAAAAASSSLVLVDLETRETSSFEIRSVNGILPTGGECFVAYGSDGHRRPPPSAASYELLQVADEINTQLGLLEKQEGYERFVAEQKMQRTLDLLERYRLAAGAMQTAPQSESERAHLRGLKALLNSRHARMMLRYNNITKRQSERAACDTRRRESFSSMEPEQMQSQVLSEEQDQRSDALRKRMHAQMNELGQMVADISLHVSLQGEEIKRIDDLVGSSEGLIKDSFFELHRAWERISGRRRRMIKFFSAWIALALLFWYFRR